MKKFEFYSLSLSLHGRIEDHSFVHDLFSMDPFVMRGEENKRVPVGSKTPAEYISYKIEEQFDEIPPDELMANWMREYGDQLRTFRLRYSHVKIVLRFNVYGESCVEWSFPVELLKEFDRYEVDFWVEVWREDPEEEFREFYYPDPPPRKNPLSDNRPDYKWDCVEISGFRLSDANYHRNVLSKHPHWGWCVGPCRTVLYVYDKRLDNVLNDANRDAFFDFIEEIQGVVDREFLDAAGDRSRCRLALKSHWIFYRNSRGEEVPHEVLSRLAALDMGWKIEARWVEACEVRLV